MTEPVGMNGVSADAVSMDAAAMAELTDRLSTAHHALESVAADLAALLTDVDSALGVGDAAQAFRRGFVSCTDAASSSLAELCGQAHDHLTSVADGADAIAATDDGLRRGLRPTNQSCSGS
ncbi:hypothetical protein [Gordonia sp. NPDC003422]